MTPARAGTTMCMSSQDPNSGDDPRSRGDDSPVAIRRTRVDLLGILKELAAERAARHGK